MTMVGKITDNFRCLLIFYQTYIDQYSTKNTGPAQVSDLLIMATTGYGGALKYLILSKQQSDF